MDIYGYLKKDHRKVADLMEQVVASPAASRRMVASSTVPVPEPSVVQARTSSATGAPGPLAPRYAVQSSARLSSIASKGSTRTVTSPRWVITQRQASPSRRKTSSVWIRGSTSHTCRTPSRA